MQGLVDIHHHLLYGLDDGPGTPEEMIRMLHAAAAQGVSCVVVTPHMQPGMEAFDVQQYQRSLAEAEQYVMRAGLPITVLPGAEIYYTTMTPAVLERGDVPRLGHGHYVLVEFHPHVRFEGIYRAAVHIANTGCAMVLAHAERYRCLRFGERLERLRQEYRVLVQVNAQTLLQPSNLFTRRWVKRAMDREWIDIVASDAHDVQQRPCELGLCAAYIEKNWGKQTAEKLCCQMPKKVISP